MSMANSLEVRVPYLDDSVVERVLRLPPALVVGRRKALLARAAEGLLPAENLTRRKQGFVLPLGSWLRGRLRGEAEETFAEAPAPLADVVDAAGMRDVWTQFAADGSRWHRPWSLYALYRWAQTL
jgi:asparagine synthase (glutamine-hydrolysing)